LPPHPRGGGSGQRDRTSGGRRGLVAIPGLAVRGRGGWRGVDSGALRLTACPLTLLHPTLHASAPHSPMAAGSLTRGRRCRSGARGLSEGPPLHNHSFVPRPPPPPAAAPPRSTGARDRDREPKRETERETESERRRERQRRESRGEEKARRRRERLTQKKRYILVNHISTSTFAGHAPPRASKLVGSGEGETAPMGRGC
jgi:hypothetical protein